MDERRMNRAELARLAGVPESTVSRWFSGTVPRKKTLSELAAALRVAPGFFEENATPEVLRERSIVELQKAGEPQLWDHAVLALLNKMPPANALLSLLDILPEDPVTALAMVRRCVPAIAAKLDEHAYEDWMMERN